MISTKEVPIIVCDMCGDERELPPGETMRVWGGSDHLCKKCEGEQEGIEFYMRQYAALYMQSWRRRSAPPEVKRFW